MPKMVPYAVRQILSAGGVRPRKRLGQNFLVDPNVARKIIRALAPRAGEVFLEIGAGIGALTVPLAEKGVKVFAVEVDPGLCRILKPALRTFRNVELIEQNILEQKPGELLKRARSDRIHVIGNLPYSITSQLILYLIEHHRFIGRALVTVQREYAERLLSEPGSRQRGSIGVLAQFHSTIENLFTISPNCFFPRPDVNSTVLRFKFRERPAARVENEECFVAVVRAAFAHRRKMLVNSIADELDVGRATVSRLLERASVDGTKRAERLKIEELARIADVFYDEDVLSQSVSRGSRTDA